MKYLNSATGLFFVLFIVFIPFLHKPLQLAVTQFIFGKPVQWLYNLLYEGNGRIDFSSDTWGLLFLLVLLAMLAAVLAFALKKYSTKLLPIQKTLTVYFLAFVLLKYGLDKVFLRQFYQPAPNLLYTPLGNLDRDILYWSTIGIAPSYQIIMGVAEVLAALLLLFARTRFMGLLLAIITLVQVVIINFTFDISVKMFSLLLLAMALYAAWTQLNGLFRFLLTQREIALPKQQTIAIPIFIKAGLKCFTIGMMILAAFTPQITNPNPNALTGAYEVIEYTRGGKVQDPQSILMKRIYIHPKNYIIMEMGDHMTDFHFTQDRKTQVLTLTDFIGNNYKIHYQKQGNTMVFDFLDGRKVVTTPLPWQQLPALQPQFHFFIDGIQ